MPIRHVRLAIALACVILAGCSSDDDDGPDVLSVTPAAANVDAGEFLQLTAELRTADGTPVGGAEYAWSTSDPAVVTVSTTGRLYGIARGSATVTVTSGVHSEEVAVSVASAPTTILVGPTPIRLLQGGVVNLGVTVQDEGGRIMHDRDVTFTVSDSFAIVNSTGVFTAVGPGQTTLTVSSGTASTSVPVEITGHPRGVAGPRIPLDSRPFGIAMRPDSTMLVTQFIGGAIGRGRTDLPAFTGSIPVASGPTSIVLDWSGDTAFVANQGSHTIGIVPLAAGIQTSAITVPGDPLRVLAWYGRYTFVSTSADSLFLLDRQDPGIVGRFEMGDDPNGMVFAPDLLTLYVTNLSSGTLSEFSLNTYSVVRTITLGGMPQDVVASPDGLELYVANESRLMQVVNVATGDVANAGAGTQDLFGLVISPDGKLLVGTRPGTGEVVLIDRASAQVVATVNTGGTPRRVAFDPLGSMAVVANEAGWVDLIR